jgi:small-conductance mechanosensitive channel/CRP-like cAMP-binding protein
MNFNGFIQGNFALMAGVVGFIAVALAVRASSEQTHKDDLLAGARWLGIFLALRVNGIWLERVLPTEFLPYIRTTWTLAFAFGMTRIGVAIILWVRRKFTAVVAPKIHRDVIDFVLYVIVAIPVLKTQLKLDIGTLLGTSAVVSLVLGFALQDTLGNLFSGLSLQLETPFRVGDFIRVGEKEGRVTQIAWRSTRLENNRRETITVPNSLIAKEKVTNFTTAQPVAVDVDFGASYSAAPNFVKAEIAETLRESKLVLNEPAPWISVVNFGESAIEYRARIFVSDYGSWVQAKDEVLSRLWYRFGRAGIEIPFPQRVVHLKGQSPPPDTVEPQLLASAPLFAPFPPQEIAALCLAAVQRKFGAGEEIITEGRQGSTFYVVLSGSVSVRVGSPLREIATLERGATFGEMSLLTGEPRSATVVAVADSCLLELGRDVFAKHLEGQPERLAQLAAMVEQRKASLAPLSTQDEKTQPLPASVRAIDKLKELFNVRST